MMAQDARPGFGIVLSLIVGGGIIAVGWMMTQEETTRTTQAATAYRACALMLQVAHTDDAATLAVLRTTLEPQGVTCAVAMVTDTTGGPDER